jgi:hypothetical protein
MASNMQQAELACFSLGLIFDPANEGDMFLQNLG